jgi:phage FluMu protein gp41
MPELNRKGNLIDGEGQMKGKEEVRTYEKLTKEDLKEIEQYAKEELKRFLNINVF